MREHGHTPGKLPQDWDDATNSDREKWVKRIGWLFAVLGTALFALATVLLLRAACLPSRIPTLIVPFSGEVLLSADTSARSIWRSPLLASTVVGFFLVVTMDYLDKLSALPASKERHLGNLALLCLCAITTVLKEACYTLMYLSHPNPHLPSQALLFFRGANVLSMLQIIMIAALASSVRAAGISGYFVSDVDATAHLKWKLLYVNPRDWRLFHGTRLLNFARLGAGCIATLAVAHVLFAVLL